MTASATLIAVLLAVAVSMPTCSSDKNVDPNKPPGGDYKKEILITLRKLFENNETVAVRDAVISEPQLRQVAGAQRYAACLRYTAQGLEPGLVGHAERIAIFYGGQVNQVIETTGGECSGAAYKPFPELNQVCLGVGCNRRR
jgi:hypothetical protein